MKALLSEHFTPNRLVGYICIRQTRVVAIGLSIYQVLYRFIS